MWYAEMFCVHISQLNVVWKLVELDDVLTFHNTIPFTTIWFHSAVFLTVNSISPTLTPTVDIESTPTR